MITPEIDYEGDPSVTSWQGLLSPELHDDLMAQNYEDEPMSADEADVSRLEKELAAKKTDVVNMPDHYTKLPVECIDVTEHFNFTLGNAIKYIWRADHKGKPIEDLEKAVWYIRREIARRERER